MIFGVGSGGVLHLEPRQGNERLETDSDTPSPDNDQKACRLLLEEQLGMRLDDLINSSNSIEAQTQLQRNNRRQAKRGRGADISRPQRKGLIAGSSLDGSRFMAGFVAQDAQTSGPRDVCGSVAARSSMNGKPAKNATIT